MSNWFVFFVQTGKEHIVCDYLNETLIDDMNEKAVAFVPQIELVYKNSNNVCNKFKPMFPGYVFTETDMDARNFVNQSIRIVRGSRHIINLLGKGNPDFMAIHEEEKDFLLKFSDSRYVVGKSSGFIKDDKVFVTSGPLKGKESVIKKIYRRNRRADIELKFMGEIRCISVSLDIVEKISKERVR